MSDPIIQMNPWKTQEITVDGELTGWKPTSQGIATPVVTPGDPKTYRVRVFIEAHEDTVPAEMVSRGQPTEEEAAWQKAASSLEVYPMTYGMRFNPAS